MATPSLAMIPSGYKDGTLYSALPNTAVGDFSVSRGSAATRVNKNGLIETVGYLTGGELITNGDFNGNANGWDVGFWTYSDGKMVSDGTAVNLLQSGRNFTAGKSYEITYTIQDYVSGGVGVLVGASPYAETTERNENGVFTEIIECQTSGDILILQGRNSFIGSIDNISVMEFASADVPRLDYTDGGCPVLLTEPQSTNEITYSEEFINTYWTKSGASIEGDASTAGAEEVVNGDFATDTDWTKSGNTTISGGKLNIINANSTVASQNNVWEIGKTYKVTVQCTFVSGTRIILPYDGSNPFKTVTTPSSETYTYYYSPIASTSLSIYSDGNGNGSIDSISVKEVQGFSSPSADSPLNAFKLVEDTSTGSHFTLTSISSFVGDVSMSVLAKKGERNWIKIGNNQEIGAYFDLENGVVGTIDVGFTANIEKYGNGWYKCNLSSNRAVLSTESLIIYTSVNGTSTSYQGDGTSGVYIFGAQLESLSYATSYIPTSGGTATRLGESVSGAGDTSTFNDSEGVLMVEIAPYRTSIAKYISLLAGTLEGIQIGIDISSIYIFLSESGLKQAWTIPNSDSNIKIAVSYDSTTTYVFINGIEITSGHGTDIPFSFSGLAELKLEAYDSSSREFIGKTKQMQYFNTALSPAELVILTTI